MQFLIDTPNHKRWMLPDGVHYYNTVIYGDTERWSVWRTSQIGYSETLVVSGDLDLNHPDWKHLSETAQALAEKRFGRKRKDVRHTNTPLNAR